MASIDDEILLRAKISSLESRISQVEETEEEVQTALEKSDSYRGMSNQAELTAVLQALFRKEEHLRTKEEQLRDEMLLWRRIHEKHKVFTSSVTGTAASTPSTGPNDEASSSSSMSDSSSTQTCDGENEHSTQMCDGEKVDSAEGPTQFSVNVYIAAPGANTECIHFEDLPPTITASCLHRRVQRRTGLSETTLRFETDMENADEVLKRVYPPGTLEDVYMVRTIETRRSTTVCFLRVDAGSVTMRDYFPGMTVLTLKSMIRARFGHPIKEQRLICAGQSLEDDRTLFSYRVEDMSTVILTGRLRGGKPVILLYPPNELEVSVRVGLSSDWSFSVLYPKPSDERKKYGADKNWDVIYVGHILPKRIMDGITYASAKVAAAATASEATSGNPAIPAPDHNGGESADHDDASPIPPARDPKGPAAAAAAMAAAVANGPAAAAGLKVAAVTFSWGLHAYLLTRAGAAELVARAPVSAPADIFVASFLAGVDNSKPILAGRAVLPPLATTNVAGGDVVSPVCLRAGGSAAVGASGTPRGFAGGGKGSGKKAKKGGGGKGGGRGGGGGGMSGKNVGGIEAGASGFSSNAGD